MNMMREMDAVLRWSSRSEKLKWLGDELRKLRVRSQSQVRRRVEELESRIRELEVGSDELLDVRPADVVGLLELNDTDDLA